MVKKMIGEIECQECDGCVLVDVFHGQDPDELTSMLGCRDGDGEEDYIRIKFSTKEKWNAYIELLDELQKQEVKLRMPRLFEPFDHTEVKVKVKEIQTRIDKVVVS